MHTLEILNLDRYQEPIRLEREQEPLRVAVKPFAGPREALFFFNAVVERLGCSPAVEELRTDYDETRDAAFLPDVVLSFEYRVQYRSSGWNFWINTPGAVVLAPGWNGFVYEAEIETRVRLHDAAGRPLGDETIPMTFDLRHADLDRSIFGGLLLVGGSAYDAVTFDDDLIGSFQAQVSETYSLHAANRVLDQVVALRPVEHRSTGSCFAIDRNGTVLTAHHLVKDARAIHVLLPSGEWELAEIAHALPAEDLAVLRLGHVTRGFLPLTPAGAARAGLPVFALAHPGQVAAGLQPEVGDGKISGLRGAGPSSRLELSAPLAAGFVGGPLANEAGLVVGVVVDAAAAGKPARAVSIDAARPALDSFSVGSGDIPRERGIRRVRSALCFVEATR